MKGGEGGVGRGGEGWGGVGGEEEGGGEGRNQLKKSKMKDQ